MIVENMDGVICIMQNKDSVLGRKWAKETPNELWAELEENLWAKHYALSAEVGNIWNWLEWGGFEDFSKQNIPILTFFFLFKYMLIWQISQSFDLICNFLLANLQC